jgi:hypothetical protein
MKKNKVSILFIYYVYFIFIKLISCPSFFKLTQAQRAERKKMEGDGSDERILALAEPYMCGGEQPVMHARVVREQVMRTLLSPPSAASAPALGQLIITNFALLFIVERSSGSAIATTARAHPPHSQRHARHADEHLCAGGHNRNAM